MTPLPSFRVAIRHACGMLMFVSIALADDSPSEKSLKPEFSGAKAGQIRDDNAPKIALVWCPPGKFTIGSRKGTLHHRFNEGPVEVTLTRGFWLGKCEVTQAQWRRVMKTEPWKGCAYVKEGDDYPATYIDWFDARDFCSKLTDIERRAGRLPKDWLYALPTEAEWEYACRAGTTTKYCFGDDESELPEYAWFDGGNLGLGAPNNAKMEMHAHQVAQLKPNGWGLYDMHGNVFEWCQDVYEDRLPGGVDPLVKTKDIDSQVFRGGSWVTFGHYCRSAVRNGSIASSAASGLGFRVAAVATAN